MIRPALQFRYLRLMRLPVGVNTMAKRTSRKPAKAAKKAAAKRVAAKAAKPRKTAPKTAPKSQSAKAGPPLRRQSSDREGLRRRPRAGLYRGHAGLETRRRAPPRRAHRAHRSRRAQGGQMELALLWRRGRASGFSVFMCFARYIKVAFFRGTSLRPVPSGASKIKDVRYLDIHEDANSTKLSSPRG